MFDSFDFKEEQSSKERKLNEHNRYYNWKVASRNVIYKSSMLLLMYIMYNLDNIPKFSYLKQVFDQYHQCIDAIVGAYSTDAVHFKKVKYFMNLLFKSKLIDLDETIAREQLISTLGKEWSKHMCLLGHVSSKEKDLAGQCFLNINKLLYSNSL